MNAKKILAALALALTASSIGGIAAADAAPNFRGNFYHEGAFNSFSGRGQDYGHGPVVHGGSGAGGGRVISCHPFSGCTLTGGSPHHGGGWGNGWRHGWGWGGYESFAVSAPLAFETPACEPVLKYKTVLIPGYGFEQKLVKVCAPL